MGLFSFLKKKTEPTGRFEIGDDSGFIGLVNNDLYESFVDEDWELEDVLLKFKTETNKGHAAIWSTGEPNHMAVQVLNAPSPVSAFREEELHIQVTNNCLWLVDYTDLTMAAQFEEESIPSKINSDLRIELENSKYKLVVRQLFRPEEYEWRSKPEYHFELVFYKHEVFQPNQLENVLWWCEDDKSK